MERQGCASQQQEVDIDQAAQCTINSEVTASLHRRVTRALKLIMVLTNGHLDHIFDVLDAHRHPCIMLGRFALLWMGVAVLQEHVSVDTVQYHFQKLTQESVSRARRP